MSPFVFDARGLLHVFPAHAGMSRGITRPRARLVGFPRSRGDEPVGASDKVQLYGFSPLTRG